MSRERWDERYGVEELIFKSEPNRFLVEEVESLKPGRALDLACGEGRNSVWLAGKGWKVTGVDFSPVGLAKATRFASERGVEADWVEADVVEWQPPSAAFDLVLVMYLHLPAEQRCRVLAHAKAALVPGGVLLVLAHDRSNLLEGTGGPQDPVVLCGPEDLVEALPGFRIERAERVTRTVATDTGEAMAIDAIVRAVLVS
ncbi:MAG: class I SAM-dependent methyltransferase [Acidimicrobiales bacterium]